MENNENKIETLVSKGFITKRDEFHYLVNYEIRSSRWVGYISFEWAQRLVSMYYLRKVRRRYKRFKKMNPYAI